MRSNWEPSLLTEIVHIHTGKLSVTDVELDNYISTDCMLNDFGGIKPAEKKPSSGKVTSFKKGDVLFSNIRTYFKKLWLADKSGACSNDVIVFRPLKGVESEYVYHVLMNDEFIEYTVKTSKGTKMPRGDKDAIMKYEFSLAPISERSKIGSILFQFKNKIELNKQTNQTLEKMAQTLFKSWFVDFDPVFDNALAKADFKLDNLPIAWPKVLLQRATSRLQVLQDNPTLQAKLTQHHLALTENNKALAQAPQAENTHQHFPSEFELTDEASIGINGWIPKGWESCQMSELVDIASSKRVFAKDYVENGVPFFRGKEITELSKGNKINTEIFISEEKYQELRNKAGAPKQGDILITSVGTIGNTYLVKKSDKFYFKDGNLTWIKNYKKIFMPFYLKEWFSSKEAKDSIERIKIGTTQQAITIKALNAISMLSPNINIIQLFEEHAHKIYAKHSANIDGIDTLTKLRDTLLSKLISGELQIPDVKKLR